MDEPKRGTVVYLGAGAPGAQAASALREHRVALIDDLNRLSGPPSRHMLAVQREFIGDLMEPDEAQAFARVCYGLLDSAVSHLTGARQLPLSQSGESRDNNVHALPVAECNTHASLPGYNDVFFTAVIPADIMERKSIDKRRNIVDRYNDAVGPPGNQVAALQSTFLSGELDRSVVARYIQQCEEMIEACNSLRHNRFVQSDRLR